MGFLFNKHTPHVLDYYSIQIQSAVQALPIPIIYGAPRVPSNIIYANGFNSVKQQTGGKGGKGLLSGGKGSQQLLYYATLICALGEGPLNNIIVIYQDANVWFNLSGIEEIDPNTQVGKSGQPNFVPTNAQLFPGGDQQLPWDYIVSRWPDDARGYKDTCYIGLPNMQLDSTATPPQLNFVPRGLFSGTCPLNPATFTGSFTNNDGEFAESFFAGLVDADPALVVQDFLTNSRYGAGFPANLIDASLFSTANATNLSVGDNSFQTYCQAIGFGWSEVINNIEAASSILDRWMKNLGVAIVWTGATLKFVPYWDTSNSNNPGLVSGVAPKLFMPNNQPILILTDAQLLQSQNPEEEPVTIDRIDPVDVYNYVRCSFRDRANQFNDNVASDSDEVAMELFGARVDNAQIAHEFGIMAYAQTSATVQLRRNLSVRRRVTFNLPPAFGFFDPMDILNITSGILTDFSVRIISLEEDENGAIKVLAEEFPAGAGSPTAFAGAPTLPPSIFQTNIPAQSVNIPAVFEPTAAMLAAEAANTPTIVVGASGSNGVFDPNWGGASVYASLDNETYTFMGNVQGPSRQGVLTADLPAYGGTNPDNTNTLSVSLAMSGGELASTTVSNAAQFLTLCVVIDADGCVELLAYTTANLVGPNAYNLTGLYRGLFGTPALEHLNGVQFLRLDGNVLQSALPPQFIGQTLYLKLTSFNIYNVGEQDLSDSDVAVYTYVPTGQGTNITSDPVVSALLAGTPVDLNTSNTEVLDLNLGGAGNCGVVTLTINLGS